MPKRSITSVAFAATFVLLTISVIAGTITMVILYNIQKDLLKPTQRPNVTPATEQPPPVMRLPKNLIPERYEVFIWPEFYTRIIEVVNETTPNQTLHFTGNSTVNLYCAQKTDTIYLHSKNLKVYHPVVKDRDSNGYFAVSDMIFHTDESDFLEIQLKSALKAGANYSLFLTFEGETSEYSEGLFVSNYYEDLDGDEKFIAATDLEPTFARKVFPCFDEPEMKAVFDVTIIHRRDTIALGNMEQLDSSAIDGDWKYTHFKPTPRMSTYLFSFTVSEFTSIESAHERVDIHLYARPEATDAKYTQYAANITGKILKFYEDLLEIDYHLKKLDQIAMPNLRYQGMENWGLVTYKEGAILYEEGVSSLLHKKEITILIAHELAHQWFGNLVTMEWWNQLWLNEGFATYMSYFAVDHIESSLKTKDVYIMNDLHLAFEVDALALSHPLSATLEDIQTTDEIEVMFDVITYNKGAIVLRMLADLVSERVFNEGVKMYLKAFEYQNTNQNDLWEYIKKADNGNTDVANMMDTWTNQAGYPVVTINTLNGEVYQKRFLFNSSAESNLWWMVHVKYITKTKSDTNPVLLNPNSNTETKEEFICKDDDWILANVNCTGYYRVNYNLENWALLQTQLETNPHRIPLMNRGQLIDDAFNLARAKLVDVNLALNLTRFLRDEHEYLPWESAVRNLNYFIHMFDRSEVYGPMQVYFRDQVKGLYTFFRNYTDNSEVPNDSSLQENQIIAIRLACSNGLPECMEMATKMYADWMKSNGTINKIHPNLRSVIYCQAVALGGREEWEFAWEIYQNSDKTSEKDQLLEALSCTKKVWLIKRYLEYTLNPEKVRLMDVASAIIYVAQNVEGQALTWNFVREHWDYISQGDISMVIEAVTNRFSTQFELGELKRFARDYVFGADLYVVYQAIEETKVNIQWVAENKDIVLEWFERETAC
ncbi:hypothetical protein PAMP_019340 [Pampus punctatissimus]